MTLVIQLFVLMALFSFIESRWPSANGHKWWRRPLLVDLCGWLMHPLVLSAGIAVAVAATDGLFSVLPNEGVWLKYANVRAHVTAFPLIAQIVIAIVLMDFLSYWIHRAYHRFPALWAFHVVHHSSEELEWLSTSRLHPVSQTVDTAAMGGALLLMGLPVVAVVAANIFIGAAALLVHANVKWTFGPLQYVLVSPLLHQWHHARVEDGEAQIGNYGAVFSIWDRLFGTWSLPVRKRPDRFGVDNAPAQTLVGLGLHPIRAAIRFFQGMHDPQPLRDDKIKAGQGGRSD